jgi:hypothetical protein
MSQGCLGLNASLRESHCHGKNLSSACHGKNLSSGKNLSLSARGSNKGGSLEVVHKADLTREALGNVAQEGRRLREYVSAAMVALDAANDEAGEAQAAARR